MTVQSIIGGGKMKFETNQTVLSAERIPEWVTIEFCDRQGGKQTPETTLPQVQPSRVGWYRPWRDHQYPLG